MLHTCQLCNVGCHTNRIEALRLQFICRSLQARRVYVGEHNLHTGVGERPRHTEAYTASSASYYGDFVLWRKWHETPCSRACAVSTVDTFGVTLIVRLCAAKLRRGKPVDLQAIVDAHDRHELR